jgi:hypothetical protein
MHNKNDIFLPDISSYDMFYCLNNLIMSHYMFCFISTLKQNNIAAYRPIAGHGP